MQGSEVVHRPHPEVWPNAETSRTLHAMELSDAKPRDQVETGAVQAPMHVPGRQRVSRVQKIAATQGGVISRRQVYAAGMTRSAVRAEVNARRWQRVGTQCLAIHCGPLPLAAKHWAAVLEAGPRACLDGASALIASGLTNYTTDRIRVSVPKGARIRRRRRPGLDLRETRRYDDADLAPSGVPRTRPATAAIRAALWARSDRQALLLITMPVQQKLCLVTDIAAELMRIQRDRRRRLLNDALVDLAGGIGSLNELDFVRGCRDRGLPEPDTQVLRQGKEQRYYLDFRWNRWKVVVEVDGIQHGWVQNTIHDVLRHNSVAITGDVVLRLPVMGLRACPDEFFEQVREALITAGCELNDVLRTGRPDNPFAGRPAQRPANRSPQQPHRRTS